MKNYLKIAIALMIVSMMASCEESNTLRKARSVGGTREILVVTQNPDQWDGTIGDSLRHFFLQDQYGLPQPESRNKLAHINAEAFSDMFKKHKCSGIQITGMPDHPIENISLSNIQLRYRGGVQNAHSKPYPELDKKYPEIAKFLGQCPAYGLFARHVNGLSLSDINIQLDRPDARPSIILDDVENVKFHNVSTPDGAEKRYEK